MLAASLGRGTGIDATGEVVTGFLNRITDAKLVGFDLCDIATHVRRSDARALLNLTHFGSGRYIVATDITDNHSALHKNLSVSGILNIPNYGHMASVNFTPSNYVETDVYDVSGGYNRIHLRLQRQDIDGFSVHAIRNCIGGNHLCLSVLQVVQPQ